MLSCPSRGQGRGVTCWEGRGGSADWGASRLEGRGEVTPCDQSHRLTAPSPPLWHPSPPACCPPTLTANELCPVPQHATLTPTSGTRCFLSREQSSPGFPWPDPYPLALGAADPQSASLPIIPTGPLVLWCISPSPEHLSPSFPLTCSRKTPEMCPENPQSWAHRVFFQPYRPLGPNYFDSTLMSSPVHN